MNHKVKENIIQLFTDYFDEEVEGFEVLPPSGSYREYYRVIGKNKNIIGAYNADIKENSAFLSFSEHFHKKGIPVPEIYAVSKDKVYYLMEDLGDTTLFSYMVEVRQKKGFPDELISIYKKVIKELPRIQIIAGKGIDYSYCYPRAGFDKQSMLWDLNYFKYYFLKLVKVSFDEQALEDDFQVFTDYLLSSESDYFMFRDFQSRNIMLKERSVYFIDYQGGRKGALQYDLASLLYDGKANLPQGVRDELYNFYISEVKKYIDLDEKKFGGYFKGFVLIRIMQAMGTYGFRGFYEKKEHFLKSIPFALKNLRFLLKDLNLPVAIPELNYILEKISESETLKRIGKSNDELTIHIYSFSYKKGIPEDNSGNGGGFVFDCRALNNPGRYEEYQQLNGKDPEVIEFLEKNSEIFQFLENAYNLVGFSVSNYLERGFTNLNVCFGCTGGQHRSVYAAEKMVEFIRNNYDVNVVLVHRELDKTS